MARRRAHGEGGLFRRNNGTPRERWVARITFEDGSRKELYAQTQAEARVKLEELKKAAELGLAMRSPRQTVGQCLTDWLENAAKPKLRPRSLPHQRFHEHCHACASLLLGQGLDLKVIQEILGHSTITITADLYAHVIMGAKRQAAAQTDAMLGGDDETDHVDFGRLAEVEP